MYHVYPLECSIISDRMRTHQRAPKKSSITTVVYVNFIFLYMCMFLTWYKFFKKFSHVHLSAGRYLQASKLTQSYMLRVLQEYSFRKMQNYRRAPRSRRYRLSLAIGGRVSSRTGSTRCPLRKRDAVRNNVPTNTVPSRRHGTNWQADEKLQLVDGEMVEGRGSNPCGSRPSLTRSYVLVRSHAFALSRLQFSPSVTI